MHIYELKTLPDRTIHRTGHDCIHVAFCLCIQVLPKPQGYCRRMLASCSHVTTSTGNHNQTISNNNNFLILVQYCRYGKLVCLWLRSVHWWVGYVCMCNTTSWKPKRATPHSICSLRLQRQTAAVSTLAFVRDWAARDRTLQVSIEINTNKCAMHSWMPMLKVFPLFNQ